MISVLLAVQVIYGGGYGPNTPLTTHDENSYQNVQTDDQQEKTGEQYSRREA